MSVYYDYLISGRPDDVLERLTRKIGAVSRWGAFHQKVGITNNPERRWAMGYRSHGWQEMRVLYRSSNRDHTLDLERRLVKRFRENLCFSPGYYHNVAPGGEGRPPLTGPFFLYVVTARKFTRFI